jgi:hypothetical protein
VGAQGTPQTHTCQYHLKKHYCNCIDFY